MKKIWQTRAGLFGLTATAYGSIFGLEILTSTGPLSGAMLALEGLELGLLTAGVVGVFYLTENIRKQSKERNLLVNRLDDVRAESEEWRAKAQAHLSGLVASISDQCDQWGLTPAERDVSFLMLKGLSHKEIAILRETHEATVRQQARSIYKKAGLNSRRAFCAYFLDDLLPSTEEDDDQKGNVLTLKL